MASRSRRSVQCSSQWTSSTRSGWWGSNALTEGGHPPAAVKALIGVLEAAAVEDGDEQADALPAGVETTVLEELGTIVSAVAEQSDTRLQIVKDLSLVRGMGYYTGPIFEIDAPGLGASIGGGSRYDGMVGRFGGDQVPACGFSLGFERLYEVLPGQDRREGSGRVALLRRAEQPVGGGTPISGFMPGLAVRLTLSDGDRVFVEALPAAHPKTGLYWAEARTCSWLPARVPAPRLRWSDEVAEWVVLVFDNAGDAGPDLRPGSHDVVAAVAAVASLHHLLTPCPVPDAPPASRALGSVVHGCAGS